MAKKTVDKESAEGFLEYGTLIDSRIIHIGTPDTYSEGEHGVTFHTASHVVKSVLLLEKASTAPIRVNVMTYGGDFYAALAIYDILKASRCEIEIRALGPVMSAGSIILQAATPGKRLSYPNTQFMLHDGTDGFHGHAKDFERWGEQSKKMRSLMYQIYADAYNGDVDAMKKGAYWRRKLSNDWILDANQAIEMGIIDGIVNDNY